MKDSNVLDLSHFGGVGKYCFVQYRSGITAVFLNMPLYAYYMDYTCITCKEQQYCTISYGSYTLPEITLTCRSGALTSTYQALEP
jgi:hypothetical protein